MGCCSVSPFRRNNDASNIGLSTMNGTMVGTVGGTGPGTI